MLWYQADIFNYLIVKDNVSNMIINVVVEQPSPTKLTNTLFKTKDQAEMEIKMVRNRVLML